MEKRKEVVQEATDCPTMYCAVVQEATDCPTMYCAGDGPYCREESIFELCSCAGSYRLSYHVLCRRWTLL